MYDTKEQDQRCEATHHNTAVHGADKSIKDPLAALQEKAADKLRRIKLVNVPDIVSAFKDKDHLGRNTTSLEIKTEYWDLQTAIMLRSRSRITTLVPEIRLESAGGYLTLVLQFSNWKHPDMNRIWNIFSSYGEEINKNSYTSQEVPVLTLSAVPLSLGGNYGMVATDPVFWCLQPLSPLEEQVSQIRVLFQPEGIIFLMDHSFQSDKVIANVKRELASEHLAEASRQQKELELKVFQEERGEKIAEYLARNRNRRHTFVTDKKIL